MKKLVLSMVALLSLVGATNAQTVVDAQTLQSKLGGLDLFSQTGKYFVVQNVTLLKTEFTENPDVSAQGFYESSKVVRSSVTPKAPSTPAPTATPTATATATPTPIAPKPTAPGTNPLYQNRMMWMGTPNPNPPETIQITIKDIQATFDLGSNIAYSCRVTDEETLNKIKIGTKVKSITISVGQMGIAYITKITL